MCSTAVFPVSQLPQVTNRTNLMSISTVSERSSLHVRRSDLPHRII